MIAGRSGRGGGSGGLSDWAKLAVVASIAVTTAAMFDRAPRPSKLIWYLLHFEVNAHPIAAVARRPRGRPAFFRRKNTPLVMKNDGLVSGAGGA
jgi:hypothetical protein